MPEATTRLLVVDDNEANRDLLSRRLSKQGYTTDMAAGGGEALSMISGGGYSLILLDIMMPGIDGLEVLRRVRSTQTAVQLPVIMVTAKDSAEDMVQALGAGANDYVTKPIDFSVVLARVKNQLALASAAQTSKDGSESAEAPPTIDELVGAGESATVEFKSTLRWHIHAKRHDDEITYACLKTINAFLNCDGGSLIIGVDDQGQSLGLADDRFQNDDKFLLHLYNVLKTSMGDAAAVGVDAKLVEFGGHTVCRVDCHPSDKPVFLTIKQKDEAFFVRTGPGTSRLGPSHLLDYAVPRFSLGRRSDEDGSNT